MPPTHLTDDLADQISASVEVGLWPRTAAILHGASAWQWRHWNELGLRLNEQSATADGKPDDLNSHERACLSLVRKIDIAEANCEAAWLNRWLTIGATGRGNGWTAFANLLERRFPSRWGKRPAAPPEHTRDPRSLEDMIADIEREGER
jgi:hypothetical protein